MYSDLYLKDLKLGAECIMEKERLFGKSVLVTGAGGLICSAVIDMLCIINENTAGEPVKIYAAGRSGEKILSRFSKYADREWFEYVYFDAAADEKLETAADYIIHGASPAAPFSIMQSPVDTMLCNIRGTEKCLEMAKKNNSRLLFISSSEIYGKKEGDKPYGEEDYGYLDILNPRACYASSKRAAETMCSCACVQYGADTVIVRPGHIYGPTMTDADNRASSDFPRRLVNGQDIVMKSEGTQLRSYCYCIDCASAILTVLIKGEKGQAYNISNSASLATIREMAEAFAASAGRKIRFEIPSESERKSYNMMDNSALDAEKLYGLGWKGVFDLNTGCEHTLKILQGR